jgi:hypothetical protein
MVWGNLLLPSSKLKNPKESPYPQYGVYIEKSVGGENVPVAWFQLTGLMQVVGWRKV